MHIASILRFLGTNVLYKICREELSRGTNPSVRSIARAFENIGKSSPTTSARSIEKAAIGPAPRQKSSSSSQLRGFFSIRKSRSVDAEAKKVSVHVNHTMATH